MLLNSREKLRCKWKATMIMCNKGKKKGNIPINVTKIGHQQHQQYLQQIHQFRMCTGMHVDKEPLNMISNVLAMHAYIKIWKCIAIHEHFQM